MRTKLNKKERLLQYWNFKSKQDVIETVSFILNVFPQNYKEIITIVHEN